MVLGVVGGRLRRVGAVILGTLLGSAAMLGHAEMPRLTARSVLPATAATAAADAGPLWHGDLRSGWREARRTRRPMIIVITRDQCVYCDAMEKATWCDEQIRRRIAEGFVAVELKVGRNDDTLSRVDVKLYPTTLLASPGGKVTSVKTGYRPAGEVDAWLTSAQRPEIH